MADEKKKIAPGYFTVEEANLICIYNKKDRQAAMEHIYRILPYTPDSDMIISIIMFKCIDKHIG